MDKDYNIKLIVVGNSQVGKSSIIEQYITGIYNIEKFNNSNINIQKKQILFFDTNINLNIIDIPYSYDNEEFNKIVS